MVGPPPQPTSREAFLAWEERQERRHEFDGARPVAMTGGTLAHAAIQRNLAISIGGRLHGTPCAFFGGGLKVVTATTVRYPDGLVTCARGGKDSTVGIKPVVIFEVLDRITANVDGIAKHLEYASLPSVRRYVMLEAEQIGAVVFSREAGHWVGRVLAGDAALDMAEIGVQVPLPELYDGLELLGAAPGGIG